MRRNAPAPSLNGWADRCHALNKRRDPRAGQRIERDKGEALALIRSDRSEALEALRTLFRASNGKTGVLSDRPLDRKDAFAMVQRRAKAAGIRTKIGWNTRYLERAVATLCQTEDVPDHLLAHLSPLGWEHVNLTGDYVWGAEQAMAKNNDGLRPLRTPPAAFLRAA